MLKRTSRLSSVFWAQRWRRPFVRPLSEQLSAGMSRAAQPLQEIPDAVYGLDAERDAKYLTVPLPIGGDHTLTITGTGTGDYKVIGVYHDSARVAPLFLNQGQTTHGSQTTQRVDVSNQATDSPQPPLVSAGSDLSTLAGQPVTFAGSFSDLNPNGTHTIRWDFGDGSAATNSLTPTHTCPQVGTYTVKLTITNTTDFTNSDTLQLTTVASAVVRPILECVANNGNGTYTAYFGYKNDSAADITLLVGTKNKFTPGPQDRGQPTTFLTGRTPFYPNAAFSVPFNGNNLVWTLNGRTATASRTSTACTP